MQESGIIIGAVSLTTITLFKLQQASGKSDAVGSIARIPPRNGHVVVNVSKEHEL